jgi:hypothetical protein
MSPNQTIAHYRIIAKLGEGGMGEVWRATDTKLGRDVAIKILPESFAQDADRLARFTREAQVLEARVADDFVRFAVTRDGQRFLIPTPLAESSGPSSATLVVNWLAGVKR